MRLILLRTALSVLALAIVWLETGRYMVRILDHLVTRRMADLPATPIHFDPETITIAGRAMSTDGPIDHSLRFAVAVDSLHRVTITRGSDAITLGRAGGGEVRDETVLPEDGDQVRFALERSALSWPTPFELNFMTGHAPRWKRNLYYRLGWTKRSGGKLEAVWRYEQWFYPGAGGWSGDGGMVSNGSTGLIEFRIVPDGDRP